MQLTSHVALSFSNFKFENVRYSAGYSMISLLRANDVKFSEISFINTSCTNELDIDSSFINIREVDLSIDMPIEGSGLYYENSSISIISIAAFINTPPTTKYLNFKDMTLVNSQLTGQAVLFGTFRIEYDLDIQISYNNISFDGISFENTGYLFEFNHQLPKNLTLSNSVFSDIQQGVINIASSNSEDTSLMTNVFLDNLTVSGIQANLASFINIEQGGRLHISNSSFTNMYSLQDGGVLTAGFTDTITEIHD